MACHNGLVTAAGEDVSMGFLWRPTMMANAARDPYWRAGVRRETLDRPAAAAAIQDECSKCHMPMMRYAAHVDGQKGAVFAHPPTGGVTPAAHLAADGVSCSMCHQVAAGNLGTEESLVGGFRVEEAAPRAPRPLSPADSASVTLPFTIAWAAASDPSGILAYNWQVSASSTFAKISRQDSVMAPATSDVVSGLAVGQKFQFRLRSGVARQRSNALQVSFSNG